MKEFIQELGINIGITIAGLFGSLIMVGKNSAQELKTTVFAVITGMASANYITPLVMDVTRVDVKYQMSVGFILGFLGLKGVELISNKIIKKANGNIDNN